MLSGQNKMDNNSYDQLLIIKDKIESNRQYYDEKVKIPIEALISMITSMMDQIKFRDPYHTGRIHRSLSFLPLWYRILRGIHHLKVDILQKMVACGISNMRSAHQNL